MGPAVNGSASLMGPTSRVTGRRTPWVIVDPSTSGVARNWRCDGVRDTHTAGASLEAGLRTLASLEMLPIAQRQLAEEAADKVAGSGLYVAVIGEFNRGKTTLINALLGAELLPTGVLPVTAVPALVRFGLRPRVVVRLLDGSEEASDIAGLQGYLTEQENPGNRKGVREAIIEFPAAVLESGLILVDTPGTGSVHLHNTQAAVDFLPRVDVALLVLSVDAPLSESEARMLQDVSRTAARIAVCVNKVDRLTPNETREAVEFVRARVAAIHTSDATVFAVSARGGDGDTGLGALTTWLENRCRRYSDQPLGRAWRPSCGDTVVARRRNAPTRSSGGSQTGSRCSGGARGVHNRADRARIRGRRGVDAAPRGLQARHGYGYRAESERTARGASSSADRGDRCWVAGSNRGCRRFLAA